jgi:hypothetical protein
MALSQLLSRRGFERAENVGLFTDHNSVVEAFSRANHPVTAILILPRSAVMSSRLTAGRQHNTSRFAGSRAAVSASHITALRKMRIADPVTFAYLLPFVSKDGPSNRILPLDAAVRSVLCHIQPGSTRHLAVVEAVRLAYQRAAKTAAQADKQCIRKAQ